MTNEPDKKCFCDGTCPRCQPERPLDEIWSDAQKGPLEESELFASMPKEVANAITAELRAERDELQNALTELGKERDQYHDDVELLRAEREYVEDKFKHLADKHEHITTSAALDILSNAKDQTNEQ